MEKMIGGNYIEDAEIKTDIEEFAVMIHRKIQALNGNEPLDGDETFDIGQELVKQLDILNAND
jgi:hypothetical protein